MQQKDCRIKLMNEILNAIKVIKLYAWEGHFQESVQNVRHKELSILRKIAYFKIGALFSWMCGPFLVIMINFLMIKIIKLLNIFSRWLLQHLEHLLLQVMSL